MESIMKADALDSASGSLPLQNVQYVQNTQNVHHMQNSQNVQTVADFKKESKDLLNRLLKPYRRYFDIFENYNLFGKNIPAMAAFHSRGEKYVLTKKAKLWGVECHEYVFFFQPEILTADTFNEIAELLKKAENEFVKPHDEHMYTHLTAIISTEKTDQEAEKMLSSFKSRKNYLLSLHGWSDIRMVMIETAETRGDAEDTESFRFVFNKDGRETAKMLMNELTEQKK